MASQSAAGAQMAAANAAVAAAIGSSIPVSSPANSLLLAEQANNLRLMAVYDRLSLYLNGGAGFETSDVIRLCYSFAKAIDCSLTLNDIPGIAPRLPLLVKKVYEWRKNAALQSAIMMVLISIKNACRRGWFRTADSEELLCMVDELYGKYCTELCPNTHVSHAFDTISNVVMRFYPRLILCSLIVSFEAKPGYDVLMSDFHFPKSNHPEQKIVLIVIKTGNLETSACITSPSQVSFLVNGKGVEKRNNVSLDCGPQLPTDLSKMIKYGINVLQTIGFFDGTYLIAVAYMSKMTNFTPALKDYVPPVLEAFDSDSEIIEGPSRISLNCPISFTRMKTPAKGHLCKHHQCFDYANFLEMNSRKPNWRCPHCNQPVCMIDLRIDQNMIKILEDVREDATEVVIHADGSWNVVAEQGKCTDQLHDGPQVRDQADHMDCEANKSRISMADPVDLTMEEDDRQEVFLDGRASQIYDHFLETEDRKPVIDVGCIPMPQFLARQALANHATNSSQVPVVSNLTERISERSIPRHAYRTPIAVQALPVPQQAHTTYRRLHANPLASMDLSPSQYQTVNISTAPLENFSSGIGNMGIQQAAITANTSAMQDHIQQSQQNILNDAMMQPVVGLPSPSTVNGRLPFSHRRGPTDMDTFRASIQPSLFARNSIQMPPGFRTHQPMSQLPQSPSLPSTNIRPAPHNTAGLSAANIGNQRSHNQALLPMQFLKSLSPSLANMPPSRDNSRVVGADRWRTLTGGTSPVLRSDGLPELPDEQNRRPIGRMRGSLTGSDYSAVMSHYMAQLNQSAMPRPSSSPSVSEQVSTLITHNLMANSSHDNFGTQ